MNSFLHARMAADWSQFYWMLGHFGCFLRHVVAPTKAGLPSATLLVPRMHMFSIRAFRQEITTSRTDITSIPCNWGWTVDGRQDQNVADLQGDALFICMDCLQQQKSFIDHNYTLLLGFILSFCEGIHFCACFC